jgi:carbon-monoxide dehydrogenase large subunit
LRGAGRYVSDIVLPGMVHARIFRSPHAAGTIRRLDISAAERASGVFAVLTAEHAAADGLGTLKPFGARTRGDGTPSFVPPYAVLAAGAVRHVGDAIAMVVAESLAEADAALELIELDIDPTPTVTETARATDPGAPSVWAEEPTNACFVERLGDADGAATAFARAAHVIEEEYVLSRVVASPMETRSALGAFDPDSDRYTLYAGSQTPHMTRNAVAEDVLGIAPSQLRVVSPDMGGGFGLKAGAQPELALVLWASKRCGRPVRWAAERSEAFLGDHHARDSVSRVALALDEAGRFLALRVRTTTNLGAYINTFALLITVANLGGLSGPYDIGAFDVEIVGAFTHTQPVAAYRGAGRPEATYCIERIIDAAATRLGIDPVELRRRNMIPPAAMPFETGLIFTYDCGEFESTMEKALALADWAGAKARSSEGKARGRLHGVGMAYAIEVAGGPHDAPMGEGASLQFDAAGDATLRLGTHSHGQGHETVFRQLIHELVGLDPSRVRIIYGDTDAVPNGIGTFGSRSAGVGSAALKKASDIVIEQGLPIASELLEAAVADIEFSDGHFAVRGTDRRIDLHDVAAAAFKAIPATNDAPAGLSASVFTAPDGATFPNGCHVCEVEIDPQTGQVWLTRYAVVDDVGRVLNPLLLDGQMHGGVAQGVGQILSEAIAFDGETGQLLSGSFMDYALPRADELPAIAIQSHEVLTANTPFGTKGAGEAGTVGSLAATMNAIMDALAKAGVTQFDMPATPRRVWRALNGLDV